MYKFECLYVSWSICYQSSPLRYSLLHISKNILTRNEPEIAQVPKFIHINCITLCEWVLVNNKVVVL